jgi:hypothetical protein
MECREKFAGFEKRYFEQQKSVRAEVHLKVAADFSEEVRRLESIIDRFNERFIDENENIQKYKQVCQLIKANLFNLEFDFFYRERSHNGSGRQMYGRINGAYLGSRK